MAHNECAGVQQTDQQREEGKEREGADTVTRKAVLRSLGFIPWAVRSKEVKQTAYKHMVFTICNKCLSGNSTGPSQKPGWF